MQTKCRIVCRRLSEKDINSFNLSDVISTIQQINYNPKINNISILKKDLIEIFSDAGFIQDINLGNSRLSINGLNQKTGLAIQTGNVARYYADLLKLEWLHTENKIENAIYVCLSKESAKDSYLSNIINIERALREIDFFDKIIRVPILFLILDFDD